MSLLGFLKGSEKAMDAVIKGGDALMLTDEERIQYTQKATELYLDHMKVVSEQSTPTSISRRYVAMTVLVPFVLLIMGSAILHAIGVFIDFEPPKYDQILALAKHWGSLAKDNFGFAVSSVIIFYYGPHALGKLGLGKK